MDVLGLVDAWPARNVAVSVLAEGVEVAARGDRGHGFRWASVTKLLTAYAALIAAEEGVVDLDEPAGPAGATVRHLLAHASGLPFDGWAPVAQPGTRRIYSNAGFETLAEHVAARAEMPFRVYLEEAVLRPLGIAAELRESPAAGLWGTLGDLVRFALELLAPRLVAPETLAEAVSVQFPGLDGVLPGYGRFEPMDWGLGFELKTSKTPHWTGRLTSPRTFGHFGGSGTFLWLDPERRIACACLTDLEFGEWAKVAWPPLADAVVRTLGS